MDWISDGHVLVKQGLAERMLRLKKMYRDEVLQVALLLSLLRIDPGCYLEDVPARVGVVTGDEWDDLGDGIGPHFRIHPKAVERDIFEDLNALGRYNRIAVPRNITAYLLNVDGSDGHEEIPARADDEPSIEPAVSGAADDPQGADLTPEVS